MATICHMKQRPMKPGGEIGPMVVTLWLPDYSENEIGQVLLTPSCATESEVDHHVDNLIQQLNEAREKAKKDLREG